MFHEGNVHLIKILITAYIILTCIKYTSFSLSKPESVTLTYLCRKPFSINGVFCSQVILVPKVEVPLG